MKAYKVSKIDDFYSTIVFAENRNRAKCLALCTDTCGGSEYIRIEARRVPEADKLYKEGKWEIDWNDDGDRLFLVKELGWACYEPYPDECDCCVTRQYCKWSEVQE